MCCVVSTVPDAACLPSARPFGRTTSHNPRWMGPAYFLPYRPSQDNVSNCSRASTTNRQSDAWPGWSEPLSVVETDSRYPKTSADEHFPWEGETERRERHRRRAKCSRKNGPRCTSNPQDLPPRAALEEHKTLPDWPPAQDCGRCREVLPPECAARERKCRRPSWG